MITRETILEDYPILFDQKNIAAELAEIEKASKVFLTDSTALQAMFGSIDLTTLSVTDSSKSVAAFVEKVNSFGSDYPQLRNVGGICVDPVFAHVVKHTLKVPNVYRAVVAASFPLSQTFTDIKTAEIRKAVEFGANEIDVVISVGEFLDENYDFVACELTEIKAACGNARLKVILETGELKSVENIWIASMIAMEAGADMIKTSTGKNCSGASPEAAYVMCQAIKSFECHTHRKVGFKPAGGVRTAADACYYYNIVRSLLGTEWLKPELFRIGASGLANALLNQILEVETGKAQEIKYF